MKIEERSNIDLYHVIRQGKPEEAEAAISELQKRESTIRKNSLRSMAVAIMARNNSHGIGTIAKTVAKKRTKKKRRSEATVKKNKKR